MYNGTLIKLVQEAQGWPTCERLHYFVFTLGVFNFLATNTSGYPVSVYYFISSPVYKLS